MDKKGKQVIMTYAEHEAWMRKDKEHREEMNRISDQIAEQEKIMEKLISDRDDIVVISRHSVVIQKNWRPRSGYGFGYDSYEDRYANFPRFLSGDELAKELDDGFMEMREAIIDLRQQLETEKSGRKKDKIDFKATNHCIPINIWNELTDRQQRRIRSILLKGEIKLRKK